jgi:hypothetical protein
VKLARRLLNRDLLVRDWDLGLAGSCVALMKTALQDPTYGEDKQFNEF